MGKLKLNKILYVPQSVNNLLFASRLVSKRNTMENTQEKMTIKKNGVGMILDARKGGNESMMFYLKAKHYVP